jgi:hypothetical protein
LSLQWLSGIRETGEVDKEKVVRIMRSSLRSNLKDYFLIGDIIGWHEQLRAMLRKRMFR